MLKAAGITSGVIALAVVSLLVTPYILMIGLGIAHSSHSPIPPLGFEACVGICLVLFATGAAWNASRGSSSD